MVISNDYVKNEYCNKCFEKPEHGWCKCQVDYLKNNFTNSFSGNEKIDNFIQEKQLTINHYHDIIFEWIPYNQLNDIKEVGKGGFATVYSATWKDGPLFYNFNKRELSRGRKRVALKCLHNSQNITNEFLNEVGIFFYIFCKFI